MSSYSFEIGDEGPRASDAPLRMNRMYRWQRSIYDVTRRCYLLGRDRMIANLRLMAGADPAFERPLRGYARCAVMILPEGRRMP